MGRWSLVGLATLVSVVSMLGIPAHATYGARVTADEPQYLLTAISLGRDGNLDIADELAAEAYRPFHRVDLPRQTYPQADGRELSPHDPLLPVLLALPVRLGGWAGAKATMAVLAGMLAALTAWVATARFRVRPRVAWLVVAALSCGAPLATYATQIYPEIPAALAVTVGLAVVTGRLDRRGQLTLVLAVTALAWLSVKYAPVGAALVGYGLWQLRRRRGDLARLAAAMALTAIVHVAVHQWLYGGFTPYGVGGHFVASGEMSVIGSSPHYLGRVRRLPGLLVDRTFGLGAWAPVWLLLPFAVGSWLGRARRAAAVLVVPLAVGWLVATFVALTMHGWWWPGRQLVVVLPLAVIAIATAVDRVPALRVPMALAAAIGSVTWLWTTFEAVLRRHVLVVDFDGTANPWYRMWRVVLPDGRRAAGYDDLLLVAWAFVLAGSAVLGWRATSGRRHPEPDEPTEDQFRLTSTGV